MSSGVARTIAGSYTGTGASLDLFGDKVGFHPKRVTIYRMTTALEKAVHVEGMADASFIKVDVAGARTLVAANGITLAAEGFTVGSDDAINTLNDSYRYFAEE